MESSRDLILLVDKRYLFMAALLSAISISVDDITGRQLYEHLSRTYVEQHGVVELYALKFTVHCKDTANLCAHA